MENGGSCGFVAAGGASGPHPPSRPRHRNKTAALTLLNSRYKNNKLEVNSFSSLDLDATCCTQSIRMKYRPRMRVAFAPPARRRRPGAAHPCPATAQQRSQRLIFFLMSMVGRRAYQPGPQTIAVDRQTSIPGNRVGPDWTPGGEDAAKSHKPVPRGYTWRMSRADWCSQKRTTRWSDRQQYPQPFSHGIQRKII